MASGVKVDEVVKLKYDDIKKKKSYRYLVFYMKDDGLAVNDQLVSFNLDIPIILSMSGIVLEHVNHVIQRDERVVDCHHIGSLLQGSPENQSSNTTKPIDTNVCHLGCWKSLL